MWVNGNGAVWRIGDEGYFWSFCTFPPRLPPPTKKKGRGGLGLVVSKWHITKACLFTFRAEGGLCAFKRRWGEGKGRKSTDWVTTAEAKSETEYFVQVDWVGVEDANVHLPFF